MKKNTKKEKKYEQKIYNMISQTEDYCIFKNALNTSINEWKSSEFLSTKKIGLSYLWKTGKGDSFYLWGESGTGKSEYLKIWIQNNNSVTIINNLEEIKNENTIYCFDAINESKTFDNEKLIKILNDKKIFLIFSGWYKLPRFHGHNINPSEEIVMMKGWKKNRQWI